MNHLSSVKGSSATLKSNKVCDGAGLFFYKGKDGGAQWLYR
ncbi:hypothetical protein [Bartonella sp. MM20NXGY]